MALFKCKMCGGALEIGGESVAICAYCGTKQTLPRLDDDRRVNLYDRANHLRRSNDFDKAMAIYEQILTEDGADAEAYWSLVLCRFGIEYVEDPSTHRRVPTVNRAQYTSIFDDPNYISALQYADEHQRTVYQAEARAINEIQRGILAISQREEPFDVFICYKETDNNGRRTKDSVLANDLYHQLTAEGFKVFFSRITLEDKLGSAYEPYIFAALNSAKVMVVLGTNPKHFTAVWVKNEWSRFLQLMKNDRSKTLIPAYRDMDPYDLPEEFSHLQAQDMSKLGFMQDLIRGIKKIIGEAVANSKPGKDREQNTGLVSVAPLLKRAFMFTEDGDWGSAAGYFEKILDLDPENAMAYVGKLMVDLRIRRQDDLKNCVRPFDGVNSYQRALRFADEELKETLVGYIKHINTRNENNRKDGVYNRAKNIIRSTNERASDYAMAANLFDTIKGWKDADNLAKMCRESAERIEAKEKEERLERERQQELRKKRNRKIGAIAFAATAVVVAVIILVVNVIMPYVDYCNAGYLMEEGKYEAAYNAFLKLGDYKDSPGKAEEAYEKYMITIKLRSAKAGDYVFLGKYEQDGNSSNGKENIEWLVLEVRGSKALLISKKALDSQAYNEYNTSVTWEDSHIRKWLNDDFVNTAFSDGEKDILIESTVPAVDNEQYDTEAGNSTKDKVFLLSIDETERYFTSNAARVCKPTKAAEANNSSLKASNGYCTWWLRTPGRLETTAATVGYMGYLNYSGLSVNASSHGVRPVIWVNIYA